MKRPLTVALLLTTACDGGASSRPAHAVRDSAGVEIVESTRPAWDSISPRQISADPLLTIGAVQGDAAYLFHGILGVRRLSDGRLVVADVGTSELRFFDPAGRFLHRVGGAGEGPGEFRFMSLVWTRAGDTIVVSDARGLSVLDPQGRFVRLIQPRGSGSDAAVPMAQLVGQLDDGTLLGFAVRRSPTPPAGQPVPDTMVFHLFGADGRYRAELTASPGTATWPFEIAPGRAMPRRIPFSAYPAWSAAGQRIYTTGGSEPEVQVWNAGGTLERLVRWSPPSLALTADLVARYRDHVLASITDPGRRQQQERWLADVPMPARMPATGEVSAILVDGDGTLWVQAYRMPWEASSPWMVFAADGAWLGSVRLRERFAAHQVGRDFVVGSWRDESGVEYVHLYGIMPAGDGRE